MYPNGTVRIRINATDQFFSGPIVVNEWQLLTIKRTGSTINVYFNGVESSTGGVIVNSSSFLFNRIGSYSTSTSRYLLNGGLANVSVYNKALTTAEITQNFYQAPIVTDGLVFAIDAGNLVSYENGDTTAYSLTGSNSGTLVNGIDFDSNNGGFWNFDGVDDKITVSTYWNTSGASEDFWFRNTTSGVWSKALFGVNGSFAQAIRLFSPTVIRYYGGAGGYDYTFPTMELNTWYHCVISDSGAGARIYLNGVESTSGQQSSQSIQVNLIGNIANGGTIYDWEGDISSVKVYNRALTAEEVLQNYNATKSRYSEYTTA
tara:strand:- start:103 stop:1053 length:951 start_codon:yes stop_codon:yes gene_type:complete